MYSLRKFRCDDPDELYRVITSIPWESLIASGGYFTVNSNVVHPTIRSGMFANVKVKDAIVDRMRKADWRAPRFRSRIAWDGGLPFSGEMKMLKSSSTLQARH